VAHKEYKHFSFCPIYGTSIKLSLILISLMLVGDSNSQSPFLW
jgi:hypothetical protein